MRKIYDAMTAGVCFALCASIGLCTLILPKKEFSQEENRALSGPPEFSVSALVGGRYFGALADFFSDQIVMREDLIRVRALTELLLGRMENGGVLFYPDGALAQRGTGASERLLLQNLGAIENFGRDNVCVLVPRAIDARGFPRGAGQSEAAERLRLVAYSSQNLGVQLLERFASDDREDRVYYRTDHHLTTYGAYASYVFLGELLGYEPLPRTDFEVQTVADDFRGSAYSAAGLLSFAADTVELWRYEGDEALKVSNESGEIPLYQFSFLKEKDKYRVFLGGNHGILRVVGEGEKPRLLLIKDSYANALIPFLALHFDVTAVDPRYTMNSVSELAESGEYDEILIFCGIDTLSTGNDLARALR